jgi:hypothetical protein
VSITANESHLRGVVVDEAQRLGLVTGSGFRDLGTKARFTEMGGRGGAGFKSAGGMRIQEALTPDGWEREETQRESAGR